MLNRYDLAYGFALAAAAPVWLATPKWRRRIFQAFRQQMGRDLPQAAGNGQAGAREEHGQPCIMVHAVSAGEMDSTPSLIAALRKGWPGPRFVVSSTSNAGYEAAQKHYGSSPDVIIVRYPLDFTPAIARVLDRLRPSLVVLMELEVWPNFMRQCDSRGIPVVLAQGRLTRGSFRNYHRFGVATRPMFRRLAFVCAQEQTHAQRFEQLGVDRQRIAVVGTMKFDAAHIADSKPGSIDGALELAASVGLKPGDEPIWVCGSTGAGEEAIVLRCYQKLLERFARLRLVIVPRHPPRFDEVAALVKAARLPLVRLSERLSQQSNQAQGADAAAAGPGAIAITLKKADSPHPNPPPEYQGRGNSGSSGNSDFPAASPITPAPVVLGNTMGALRRFYNLADVIFIGRTLVDLGPRQHGSNMIEAAALGKPIAIGPFTGNFAEPMNCLRQAMAIAEVRTEDELTDTIADFLEDQPRAMQMAQRAQEVVRREQGATERHAKIILETLEASSPRSREAAGAKENAI